MTEEPKSKSQVKREMTALQDLGEQLVALSADQIHKIAMPEDLREAVLFARTLTKHEARRRQLQYIGVLMREADPEPIERAIEAIRRGQSVEAQLFHQLEGWRDRLIEGDEALIETLVAQYPAADRQRLRQLSLNARKEREAAKPPKSSRALFRYLRELAAS